MKRVLKLFIGLAIVFVSIYFIVEFNDKKDVEFVAIKSEDELNKILTKNDNSNIFKYIFTLPVSLLGSYGRYSYYDRFNNGLNTGISVPDSVASQSKSSSDKSSYSTTNIQVENVDEADVVKTDGEYIYSISDSSVIVSKTNTDGTVEIVSKIDTSYIPEDILINGNKLIVVCTYNLYKEGSTYNKYYDYYNYNTYTTVNIYDITDKTKITKIKDIELDKDYYTSRMIEDKIYVLTTGYIEEDDDKVILPCYSIDRQKNDIAFNNIKYMRDNVTTSISTVASIDLSDLENGIDVSAYLMPIDNAYISENNMYLVFSEYENNYIDMTKLFTFKGIPGFLEYIDDLNYSNEEHTTIVKFKFVDEGIEYVSFAKEIGSTLNQFSMDEFSGNLRVTLSDGTNNNKLVVYSSDMKKIGQIEKIAPGEKIYSTRFIENRAYVVTFKTIDPLFVIDLSDATNPKILGELKIPGYSTYIHPYDENHIIGIGNDTTTEIYRDAFGKVTSERTYITGMKMSIFDITDVKSPKEMFNQKIGDRYTYSSILVNHKALLFSKEKELLAIPINNYKEEISLSSTTDVSSNIKIIDSIKNKPTTSGYIVYNINLAKGFSQKGIITHDSKSSNNYYWYGSYNSVRGIYIGNILYTISEDYIKSNKLDTLDEIFSVKIGG